MRNSILGFGSMLVAICVNLAASPSGEPAPTPSINAIIHSSIVTSTISNQELALSAANPGMAMGTNNVAHIKRETLGPSSRRTGWVITEIMYSPGTLAGGKSLEFIEIYNSEPTPEDIGGFRLTGSIDYTFPAKQIVPPGGFLVVAKTPEDVADRYHLSAVFGGWSANLPRDDGRIRLLDRRQSVLLDIEYHAGFPWPMASDGGGHSIVLAKPSYGENNAAAWAQSSRVGGSPGADDPALTSPLQAVKINEILANSGADSEDFVELYNHGNETVDISGCVLTDDPGKLRYRFPAGTLMAPRSFVAVKQHELGFGLKSYGEQVFLYNPDIQWAVDAVRFGGQVEGISTGRCPDGADEFRELAISTPGATNAPALLRDIVINEIMYHPISGEDGDQYVELYNRGSNTVNLAKWRFTAGIDFTFPDGAAIPPNGYLVVAKNAAQLRSHYAQLNTQNTIGDFNRRLSHDGDRIVLAMPQFTLTTNAAHTIDTNTYYVAVNEVAYGTGGRWGRWSDGGGSSLELVDARADNRRPSNWADSDETAKAPWSTVEATGTLDLGVGSPDSLQLFLQGEGECLIDDVEVVGQNGTNLVANPSFENGTSGWFLQGTHEQSYGETNGGFNSARSLHVVAAGRGDTGANRIRTVLNKPLPAVGKTATLRAKARWLRGNPGLLLRLHGNWLESAGKLALPTDAGTPGAANSRSLTNAGPAVFQVRHSPVLPAAQQDVVVTARVLDFDGIASVNLNYRLDPNTDLITVPMSDDGSGGDAVAGDGLYSATIPGQAAGVMVAFHIEASDKKSVSVTNRFPQDAPARECLIRFGEGSPAGNFGVYRIWMTKKTTTAWTQRMKLHNSPLDATFVYGDQRAIYNVGASYAGSPWVRPSYSGPTGALCGYDFSFPDDDRFLGSKDMAMDYPVRDDTYQQEQAAYWIAEQMGLPTNHRRFVQLYVNGAKRSKIYEDTQRPNRELLDQYFAGDTGGDLFKLDDGFEFDASASNFERDNGDTAATLENFTTTGGVKKTARYRWHWRKRAESGSVGDYTSLFNLVDAVNAPQDTYTEQVQSLVNIDEWMGVFAVEHIVGNWDSYGYQRGKNMFAFKPGNDKWQLLMWDIDFVMAAQGDSSESYFYSADPTISRLFRNAPFQRAYYRALGKALNGPLAAANIEPVLDAKYAALKANGVNAISPSAAKTFLKNRRISLTNQLNSLKMDFTAYTAGGGDYSTVRNWVTLNGIAPVEVSTIKVNGVEWPVTWNNVLSWSLRAPLNAVTNNLAVQGFDQAGNALAIASTNFTILYTGLFERPQDCVAINEIMYHPTLPGAEFVELYNRSSTSAFDLSGYRLSGIDFTFAPGTIIEPEQYLVVVKSREAFWAAYGNKIPVAGEFAGRLNPSGEILRLIKPSSIQGQEMLINEVAYGSQFPWPADASLGGVSLQLLDPQADNRRAANWTAISPTLATNRQWQFASTTGVATNSRVLLYHSPLQTRPDPWDISGYWDGSISLPGLEYAMTIGFTRGVSNQWSGTFQSSEISIPLNAVRYNKPSVYFDFSGEATAPKWQGILGSNGMIIGTFTQATQTGTASYPFKLKRRVDDSIVWGGEVYLDDLSLVEGDQPGVGVNLIANGDFEKPLTEFWQVSTNCTATLATDLKHSGSTSLRLAASLGGDGEDTAVWQDAGALTQGKTYTLSYWYYRGTNGNDVTVRTADNGLAAVRSLQPGQSATPGKRNSVSDRAPALPSLFLSEIETDNVTGLADQSGHRGSWIELVNLGNTTISLNGFFLSIDPSNLTQWAFPSGDSIEPGQYRIVWLDGHTNETTAQEWHANFNLPNTAGMVLISQIDRGRTNVVDYLNYPALAPDHSYGAVIAGELERQLFGEPTPGIANDAGAPVPAVFINEWMAINGDIQTSSTEKGFHDWFELYNAGAQAVELSGYSLTDNPAKRMNSILPDGTQIAPGGFLIVVANGVASTNANSPSVSFKLDKEGDYIGLYTPNGQLVDEVSFGLQTANISQGRWPDGHAGNYVTQFHPTPGLPNQKPVDPSPVIITGWNLQPGVSITIAWTSYPGRFYRVQCKTSLTDPAWQDLGELILANGATATASDNLVANQTQRFYRVLLIE